MGLTAHEIARLLHQWRGLAEAARLALASQAALGELKTISFAALQWSSPLEQRFDAFVLFALARLCDAYSRAPVSTLELRRPALEATLELAAGLLGEDPPPPTLPFRADLDG